MEIFEKQFTFDRVVRIIIGLVILTIVVLLLDYLSSVLIPFVIALLLAYLMNPLVNLLQRLVKKRAIAVFLSLFIVLAFFTLLGVIFIPLIINEVSHMADLINDLVGKSNLEQEIRSYLPENMSEYINTFLTSEDFKKLFSSENTGDMVNFAIEKLLPSIGSIFSETLSLILGFFGLAIIILYLFFLLIDYETVLDEWKALIPPKFKPTVLGVIHDFEGAMNNYFRAQALIASIVGVLFAIGFTIIGLPMGIVLGLTIGALCMVPYLHNLGVIPAVFLALMKSLETGSNFWLMLLFVAIVFGVVQMINDFILTPKIMGNATGLNAAVILLSLSVWGKLLGMLGLLIALPMTYLILTYYRRFINKNQKIEGPDRIPDIQIDHKNVKTED